MGCSGSSSDQNVDAQAIVKSDRALQNKQKSQRELQIEKESQRNKVVVDIIGQDANKNQQLKLLTPGQIFDYYKLKGLFAEGVYYAEHLKTGKVRAAKKIPRNETAVDSLEKEGDFIAEVQILQKLQHPNIINVIEYFVDNHNIYVITEVCEGGELLEWIEDNGIDENMVAFIIKQILQTLNYIHKENIVHRDLNVNNLLLKSDDLKDGIKIIDFGSARVYKKGYKMTKKLPIGKFTAPEVIECKYNYKCDIWSCGVILYVLLTGKHPFEGSGEQLKEKILNVEPDWEENWGDYSPITRDFCKGLLCKNPKDRLKVKKILDHPWLKKADEFKKEGIKVNEQLMKNIKNFKADNKL